MISGFVDKDREENFTYSLEHGERERERVPYSKVRAALVGAGREPPGKFAECECGLIKPTLLKTI